MSKEKILYYHSFEDDFFQEGAKYRLEKDYQYIKNGLFYKIGSALLYGLAFVISTVYCRLFLHVRFVGARKLRKQRGAFFIYGNHTQPIGDVFDPALACFPKRIYTVVSVANMHLPVIGKLLRPLGALPLPDTVSGMRAFNDAIKSRTDAGHPIVIYPEAHLWEYYTKIRPFKEGSFHYPARLKLPSFCMTATYQKRRLGKKPKITIYVDGPFLPEGNSTREQAASLCKNICDTMQKRAKLSNCEYVKYVEI